MKPSEGFDSGATPDGNTIFRSVSIVQSVQPVVNRKIMGAKPIRTAILRIAQNG